MGNREIIRAQRALFNVLTACAACALGSGTWAAGVPSDVAASPDIYRAVAENAQYRIVEGTWKPGQRDQFHSHPSMLFYWVTGCEMRWYLPDGSTRDYKVAAGFANVQPAVASHAVENRGTTDCKVIMFEEKQPGG